MTLSDNHPDHARPAHPPDPARNAPEGQHDAEANPWRTLKRRMVYENPWILVYEDQVIRPDNQPGIYGVVRFRNRAIAVVPVEDNGDIWMVGQYRYPLGLYSWEVPEGGGSLQETPEDAARRELQEETGLIAAELRSLGAVHLSNAVTDEKGYIFRATGLTPGPSAPEGTERLIVRRVPWEEVWSMLLSGAITDSLSVIALLWESHVRQGLR